jgi:uncharacterized heparinase superfamily protein
MKKLSLVLVVAAGAALCAMPSCKKKSNPTTYTCTCDKQSVVEKSGLSEEQKNEYETTCRNASASTPRAGATPQGTGTPDCNPE